MANEVTVDAMTSVLLHDVDSRFRVNRKGNPVEITYAIDHGVLTEAEIHDLVTSAGVGKEFTTLPDGSSKELVKHGLSSLWKIDRIGSSVENKDREVVGSVAEMRASVQQNLDEIRNAHHSAMRQWLPASVSSLVRAATEEDPNKRMFYKNGVMAPADGYTRSLVGVGYEYKEKSPNIREPSDKDRVNTYLKSREVDTQTMKDILNRKLGMALSTLQPDSPAETYTP